MVRYILFGLIALGVVGWMGIGPFSGFFATSGGQVASAPAAVAVQPVSQVACDPSDGKNDAKVTVRNAANNSLDYDANTVYVVAGGVIDDSGTANGGATLSYKTLNVKCSSRTATVYAVAGNTNRENSGRAEVSFAAADTAKEVNVLSTEMGNLSTTIYDAARNNASTPDTLDNDDIAESAATTMGQSDSRTFYVRVKQANSSAAFGGFGNPDDPELKDAGILWGIDTISSSVFADDDVAMWQDSGANLNFREISCSKFTRETAKYSLNKCYVSKAIGAKSLPDLNVVSGDVWLGGSLKAGQGNPGASDDPVIWPIDLVWFQDTDGSIKYGGVDASNTDVGRVDNKRITLDNS